MVQLPAQEPPIYQPPPERITIGILMLWTAMSAVLLAFDRATNDFWSGRIGWLSQVVAFFYAPLWGSHTAAVVLMVWRYMTDGPRFPTQPGHWLLVIGGVHATATIFLSMVVLSTLNTWGYAGPIYEVLRLLTLALATVLYCLPLRTFQQMWGAAFVCGAVTQGVILLVNVGSMLFARNNFLVFRIEFVTTWVVLGAILLAVISDLRCGQRRDSLHTVGIFATIAMQLLITAIPLALWLLKRWNYLD
ncbi:hypothetical protein NA78x_001038 [Anatilimnocola sp. NA78]|uniref:hypothetical protein n=1 Tax=Anatilimnocola sp. NA78 TaxID=3415683 RepID=UPI003CE4680C